MLPSKEYVELIPAELDQVGGYFDRAIERINAQYGAQPTDVVDRLRLAFAEAIANAIEHGNGVGGDPVEIKLTLEEDTLSLDVSDTGPGYHLPRPDVEVDLERESGRGVFLMRQMMDEVEYELGDDRNTLRLVKHVSAKPVAEDTLSAAPRTVLVVDDDEDARWLIGELARDYCDEILLACDGTEALETLSENPGVDAVLLDVNMPGLSGLEVTRRIRGETSTYTPILLVTGSADEADLVRGFDAGADDYIVKPPRKSELASRLRAAFRMRDAIERQRRSKADLDQQLQDARKIQLQSLPPDEGSVGPLVFAAKYRPYRYVGGDVYNYFSLGPDSAGFFIADISGHGVGAAMWSMWVSRMLSPGPGGLGRAPADEDGHARVRSPAEVCALLDPMIGQDQLDKYFTSFMAHVDWRERTMTFCQAGHPPAILIRSDGSIERLESGSPAVGFELGIPYEDRTTAFEPGDRVFIYSDCVTETFSPSREPFGEDRLVQLLAGSRFGEVRAQLAAVTRALDKHKALGGLDDDLTLLAIQFSEE